MLCYTRLTLKSISWQEKTNSSFSEEHKKSIRLYTVILNNSEWYSKLMNKTSNVPGTLINLTMLIALIKMFIVTYITIYLPNTLEKAFFRNVMFILTLSKTRKHLSAPHNEATNFSSFSSLLRWSTHSLTKQKKKLHCQ